jgi:hypothetical protein
MSRKVCKIARFGWHKCMFTLQALNIQAGVAETGIYTRVSMQRSSIKFINVHHAARIINKRCGTMDGNSEVQAEDDCMNSHPSTQPTTHHTLRHIASIFCWKPSAQFQTRRNSVQIQQSHEQYTTVQFKRSAQTQCNLGRCNATHHNCTETSLKHQA